MPRRAALAWGFLLGALLLVLLRHLRLFARPVPALVSALQWTDGQLGLLLALAGVVCWRLDRRARATDAGLPLLVAAVAATGSALRHFGRLDLTSLATWLHGGTWLYGHVGLAGALIGWAPVSVRHRNRLGVCLGVGGLAAAAAAFVSVGSPRARVALADPPGACVEPASRMRAEHPALLAAWRDAAVREDRHEWVASDGRRHPISLTGTCLRCHDNASRFCGGCHATVGVAPTCLGCHVPPEGK